MYLLFLLSHAFPSSPSAQSLNIPDRDPSGLAVGRDGLAVITTNLDVLVARDGTKVSSLSVDYEPVCVAFHPSEPEVAVGGKVGENRILMYQNFYNKYASMRGQTGLRLQFRG